ncbi:hypothetical protein [Maricaulis sp.]
MSDANTRIDTGIYGISRDYASWKANQIVTAGAPRSLAIMLTQ